MALPETEPEPMPLSESVAWEADAAEPDTGFRSCVFNCRKAAAFLP
jgi:hypothetical protein